MSKYLRIDRPEGCDLGTGFKLAIQQALGVSQKGATVLRLKDDFKASNPAVVVELKGKVIDSQIVALNAVLDRFDAGVTITTSHSGQPASNHNTAILRSGWTGKGGAVTIADAIPSSAKEKLAKPCVHRVLAA